MLLRLNGLASHLCNIRSLCSVISLLAIIRTGSATELSPAPLSPDIPHHSTLLLNQHKLYAEVVNNDKTRTRGLMYRSSLPDDAGMLFIFPDEKKRCFWMKNTAIPLSIAYMNHQGRIINVFNLQPYDETPVCSTQAAMFALEVNQGWFTRKQVEIGDIVYTGTSATR